MDNDLIIVVRGQIADAWELSQGSAGASAWEAVLEELQERVMHLLRYNPRKLMSALYILDDSERRYLAALDQPTMEDRALDLARAILERETEKIETRRRYAQPPAPAMEDHRTEEREP